MKTKQSGSGDSKKNWFKRHWIITTFLVLFIIGTISSGFEEGMKEADPNYVAEQEKTKTPEELRIEKIESQFSAWDGAHRPSEKIIMENLKDPDSYEVIKTVYVDKGEYIIVQTKYRAKNSFGGYVVEYLKAKFSLEGDFIEIHDSIGDEE